MCSDARDTCRVSDERPADANGAPEATSTWDNGPFRDRYAAEVFAVQDEFRGSAATGPFRDRLGDEVLALTNELGVGPTTGHVDLFFLAFLRMMSRFGVFAFGPITIYVPTIEELIRRMAAQDMLRAAGSLVRLTNLMVAEQRRIGGGPINELHMLLAFMRINEGVPALVFGELGVRPEQVEEYARSAGASGGASGGDALPLERLYSPEEAAEYLGVHVQTVRAWIRSGRLKASRLTGQRALRITASDLMTVLEPIEAEDGPI